LCGVPLVGYAGERETTDRARSDLSHDVVEVEHFPEMQQRLGHAYTQGEVDRLYLAERARVGAHDRVRWLYPVGWGAARHAFALMP
jgi:hypothetical protein